MGVLRQDIRYAIRSAAKRPIFVLVAVLSLSVGIGATTAIFGVVNRLLLTPLPGIEGFDRVVEIGRTTNGSGFEGVSYPDFLRFRAAASPLAEVAGSRNGMMSRSVEAGGERTTVMYVSANYFTVMGVQPFMGRTFLPNEDEGVGEHPVVVVSHAFWTNALGSDPDAIGTTLQLNRETYTLVGVAPDAFRNHMIGLEPEMWIPLMQSPGLVRNPRRLTNRNDRWLPVVARMTPEATLAQAQAAVRGVFAVLAEEFPVTHGRLGARAVQLGAVPANGRLGVQAFMAALAALVGLVLMITCANVAGMLLARNTSREKEIAVRLALGASRGRLIRHLTTESMLLFALGGAGGLVLATWGLGAINLAAIPLPIALQIDFSPDGRVLAFALLATLTTGLVFGALPALQATRPDLVSVLKDDVGGGGRRRSRLRRVFVAGQVGMSLPLLIAAGLFLRSLQRADSIGTGFDPEGVYMTTLDLSMEGYATPEEGMLAFDRILERVRAIPGALYAAVSTDLPLDGSQSATMSIPEGRDLEDPASRMRVPFNQVTDEYFATLGIPLLAGRAFDSRDTPESTAVAVVSREFARVAWPDGEVLGRRFLHGFPGTWLTIVGVVEDVKNLLVTDPAESYIYRRKAQNYTPAGILTVRFAGGLEGIAEPLRRSILEVDPRLSMTPVFSVAEYTSVGMLPQRMAASIASGLGLVALLLSGIGIYGVVAFSVLQRTREIGVRMALGADRGRVLRGVIRDALGLALPGLVLGAVAAVILGRLLEAFLLGVSPLDPAAFAAVGCALLVVVLIASFVPARRAARVDPSEALRY